TLRWRFVRRVIDCSETRMPSKGDAMRADGHQRRAEQFEHSIDVLGNPDADPDLAPSLIEFYWAATFHWIAYGCQAKHGKYKEHETQLGQYLRDVGELAVGETWDRFETVRWDAMFASRTHFELVARARDDWQEICAWALS